LKKLTEKWSWYRRGCGYRSSILDFLEQLVGERACNIVFKPEVPAQVQLQKVEDGRAVAKSVTVTILLSEFSKMWCTMLGHEHLSRMYHDEFLAWYAQRGGEFYCP